MINNLYKAWPGKLLLSTQPVQHMFLVHSTSTFQCNPVSINSVHWFNIFRQSVVSQHDGTTRFKPYSPTSILLQIIRHVRQIGSADSSFFQLPFNTEEIRLCEHSECTSIDSEVVNCHFTWYIGDIHFIAVVYPGSDHYRTWLLVKRKVPTRW